LIPFRHSLIAAVSLLSLVGCGDMKTLNVDSLTQAGGTALKAASLTDGDIRDLTDRSCAELDKKSPVAPANDKYALRLNTVVKDMPTTINGQPVNYKVYRTNDVNAWAMANGCIRVYSGLMDLMTDDELRGVIGHEEGHVALGHTKKAMQTAYATNAVRQLAGASGGVAASLSESQMGELAEKFVNAQFSQSQESDADNYSFDLLTQQKLKREGLVTAFQKLAKLDGGKSSMFSSHPSSADRAQNMQKRIDQKKS
jgi:metalloprotease